MAMTKEPADDLQTVTRMAPAEAPDTRSVDLDQLMFDEPIAVVDAPVPLREPLPKKQKRRRR
jgi:hypothetical protein